MTNSRDIPWARISIEGIAIVASILLAFAIDAWWEERQFRVTEQRELHRLQSEFNLNHERNRGSEGMQGVARDASWKMYQSLLQSRNDGEENIEIASSEIDRIISTPTFEVETPVYDSLIRSGRIEVIENLELLEALSLWERAVANAAENEVRARQYFDNHIVPVLLSNSGITDVIVNHWVLRQDRNVHLEGTVSIRVDDRIIGQMAQRYMMTAMAARSLEGIAAADKRVMAAIVDSLEQLED